MEFENPGPEDAEKVDQYFKLIASRTGREIANYVASNVLIRVIEYSLTLEDAEKGIESAIDKVEELIAPFLQEDETTAQSFERERDMFVDNYMEVLKLRLSAIAERLDDGG